MQFVAVTALGLLVYWIAKQWLDLTGTGWAAVIWIAACCLFAVIYDRRQAKMHQSIEARTKGEQAP